MRYIILIFLSVGLVLNVCAQSRETASNGIKIESMSEKLRDATGWKKDALGTWISNENAISDMLLNEKNHYSVPQNFKWLQFAEFTFDNKPYYALLYESENYVSAAQPERRVYYYVMSPASYQNLTNTVSNKTAETLAIHSNQFGYMSNSNGGYTQAKLLELITHSLLYGNNIQSDFKVNAQHVDRADVVRFRLPEQTSGITSELSDSYFEVKWDVFKPLLLPVKNVPVSDEFELEYKPTKATENTNNDGWEREAALPENEISIALTNNDTIVNTDTINSTQHISERVSDQEPVISNTIAVLNGITGWYKNSEGKWVSENDYSYNFETVGQYELRMFTYKDKEYLILIRSEKYAGATYYLIKKEDYDRELEKLYTTSTLNFPIIASCGIGNTLDDLVVKAKEAINSPEKERIIIRDNYLTLQQKTSREKDIARFFVYEKNCTQYGESGSVACNANVSNKIRYDEVQYIGTNELFSKMYYETNYNKFVNFFRAPSKDKLKINNTGQRNDLLFD